MQGQTYFVRCFGERANGQWTIVCLDFCLAAQADTFEEARARLDAQIRSYLRDALTGQDREHAAYLLSRRAPWPIWAKYYGYKALWFVLNLFGARDGTGEQRPFREPIPMVPAPC